MRKAIIAILLLVITISCTTRDQKSAVAGLANPFTDAPSLSEAEKLAGFSITLPSFGEEYGEHHYRVLTATDDRMLEVIFKSADGDEIRLRKEKGSADISGDYNHYDTVITEGEYTLRGNGELFSGAVWHHDGFSYSLMVSSPVGKETLLSFTKQIF